MVLRSGQHIAASQVGSAMLLLFPAIDTGMLTFQNCLLASLPPTRFKIFAPPGCSSTKPPIS